MAGVGSTSAHNIGMDFLDVKREILDELKQVDRKAQEKYQKNQRRRQHQLSHKDIQVQNGHMIENTDNSQDNSKIAIIQDNSVQELRLENFINNLSNQKSKNGELNADIRSCSQTLAKMRSKSSSPLIHKLEKDLSRNEVMKNEKYQNGALINIEYRQPAMQTSATVQRLAPQRNLAAVNPTHAVHLKSQLQKFIK